MADPITFLRGNGWSLPGKETVAGYHIPSARDYYGRPLDRAAATIQKWAEPFPAEAATEALKEIASILRSGGSLIIGGVVTASSLTTSAAKKAFRVLAYVVDGLVNFLGLIAPLVEVAIYMALIFGPAFVGGAEVSSSGPSKSEAYDVLGVNPTASETEVKQAWREKAKETHPDRGGSVAAFQKAREAKETILD